MSAALAALLLAAGAPCWDVGPTAPSRLLRGVLVRDVTDAGARWTLNLPQPVCASGLTGRTRQVTLLPRTPDAERRLQTRVRLRITISGRPELAGQRLVLPVD